MQGPDRVAWLVPTSLRFGGVFARPGLVQRIVVPLRQYIYAN